MKTLIIAMLLCAATATAQERHERYAGRPLAEALQLVAQHGLRIVFSSAVVTTGMRVITEPRATDARLVLDELLRPHGLAIQSGPGGVLQIVRAPRVPRASESESRGPTSRPGRQKEERPPKQPPESPPAYDEEVVVLASADERRDLGVASQSHLDGPALRARSGVLAGDPLRAVRTLPRVAASDDFRGEFSVRGSAFRHVGVVIDGVSTPYLLHAAYGAGDSGSLAMFNPDVIERATLQAGAYPRRFEDRLGAQLVMTLREGSRARTSVGGFLGGVAASIVGEGPLGTSSRGSWLVSARHSFLDWPTTRFGAEYSGMGFGFRDLQAKAVFDATPTQQVSVTTVSGQSLADHGNDIAIDGVLEGAHRATMATVGWRSTLGSSAVLSQRVHVIAHDVGNRGPDGVRVRDGRDRELAYRMELVRAWPRLMFEIAGEAQRSSGSIRVGGDTRRTRAWERAGFVHAAWSAARGLTIAPGVRIGHSTLASRSLAAPWILGEWVPQPGWALTVSAGLGHQFPDVEHVSPERARYLDVSIERTLAKHGRVQATLFDRAEPNVLDGTGRALRGTSRGAEVAIDWSRRSSPRLARAKAEHAPASGLSASASYSFGRARYTDGATAERFWADFDQRHAVNVFASYRFSRATLSAAFTGGSNFPIAGYFVSRDGGLFVGDRRNDVRRPPYARLDVLASRTFTIGGRDVVLYGEMLNTLNRTNFGPADGVIRTNGEAVGFIEKLLPRFVSGGLRVQF